MPRQRVTQNIPGVQVTAVTPDDDRRCSYVSPELGRCRYWGTIQKSFTGPKTCVGHYRNEIGPEAEQVVESSNKWRRVHWNLSTGNLQYDDGTVAPLSAR